MSLFDDSIQRLRARAAGFDTDLQRWLRRTAKQGDLPQHHTQVLRLSDYLSGMLEAIVQGTPVARATEPPFAGTVDDLPKLRRGVGSVHLVWDFFRDKLSQRDTAAFTAHLGAADDLAWACYQPFLNAATGSAAHGVSATEVREPPLVFYSTDRTPFAQARTKTLHPPGLDAKDLQVFEAALQQLPVPVIGMPWDIANRMPETCLIGHEVGHVIAEDLRLVGEAATAIREAAFEKDAGGVRKKVWSAWRDEIFADVIGVLATGSAFLESLTVELADARDEVRLEPINVEKPGRYPTRMLRVALCRRFLDHVQTPAPAEWTETYGQIEGPSKTYADDVPIVAAALMDRRWLALGGRRLAEVLPWGAEREEQARLVGSKRLRMQSAPVVFDVRTWVAASMHAYRENPATYRSRELDQLLAEEIVGQRLVGTRSSIATRERLMERETTLGGPDIQRELRLVDRMAGADFARHLGLT
ncbi:hypothetical protein [Actinoplanes aureus]|uniref:Uncharacterized protein n=1 Tax=Actinoplanes aureus TaxID=2792083 RepID=A0A931G2Y9_9ACTN|nr:hypothetical protein [Actinoplanes aureus]MBG0563759.1 hypothetical protein [Actinoplanes aureus]